MKIVPCLWFIFAVGAARTVSAPADIGSQRQLFVDSLLVDELHGANFQMGRPIPREVAIASDRPWDGVALFMFGLFERDGVLQLYYRCRSDRASETDETKGYVIGYARSRDGIHWEKPNLGLVGWSGSKDNNLVQAPDGGQFYLNRASFFIDPRPGVPESERIKVLVVPNLFSAWAQRHSSGAAGSDVVQPELWVSGDGVRFRKSGRPVYLTSKLPNAFDSFRVFWSEAEQRFVGYFRFCEEVPLDVAHLPELDAQLHIARARGDRRPDYEIFHDWAAQDVIQPERRPGVPNGPTEKKFVRNVFRSASPDLVRWTATYPMSYGDSPRENIYEPGPFPYFRAPQQYVCLANRLMQVRRALSDEEVAAQKLHYSDAASGGKVLYNRDCNDLILMSTRPGSTTFTRLFMEAFARSGIDLANWTSRNNYSSSYAYQTGPDEMSFLITRHHQHDDSHLQRFSLRLDGFASINAPYGGGEMVTVPLRFAGNRLELNYATSAAGDIEIEIQDADRRPLPGFALAESDVLIGDRISGEARWRSGADVGTLAGKPVRLRFVMRDADLYSFRFH